MVIAYTGVFLLKNSENENNYINIRNLVYNYLYSNQNAIYEFCEVENNYLVVKFEKNSQIITLKINEYIDSIKKSGFYGGFYQKSTAYSNIKTYKNL